MGLHNTRVNVKKCCILIEQERAPEVRAFIKQLVWRSQQDVLFYGSGREILFDEPLFVLELNLENSIVQKRCPKQKL